MSDGISWARSDNSKAFYDALNNGVAELTLLDSEIDSLSLNEIFTFLMKCNHAIEIKNYDVWQHKTSKIESRWSISSSEKDAYILVRKYEIVMGNIRALGYTFEEVLKKSFLQSKWLQSPEGQLAYKKYRDDL